VYIGPEKIIVVLVIALIVLGPERLPQVARQAGRAYREFRRVTSGFEAEVRDALQEPMRAFSESHPAESAPGPGDAAAPPALAPAGPATPTSPPPWTAGPPPGQQPESRPVGTPAGDPSLN
jgi:sec-independent protein translocase protein TatB